LVIESAKIVALTSYANIFPSFYRKYLIFQGLNFIRSPWAATLSNSPKQRKKSLGEWVT